MNDEVKERNAFLQQFIPAAEPQDETGLPPLNNNEYQPHARPSAKPLYALHCLLPDGTVQSFQYVHLDSHSRYSAGTITLRFMGMQPVTVTIEGINLWRLYDYLHQHRIAWVAQAPRAFAENGKTLVTRMVFTSMKPET